MCSCTTEGFGLCSCVTFFTFDVYVRMFGPPVKVESNLFVQKIPLNPDYSV